MKLSDKAWNILNSAGAFIILAGAVLAFEERIGLTPGLRNVLELMIFLMIFSVMLTIAALIAWGIWYFDKQTNKKRYSYWFISASVLISMYAFFAPDSWF